MLSVEQLQAANEIAAFCPLRKSRFELAAFWSILPGLLLPCMSAKMLAGTDAGLPMLILASASPRRTELLRQLGVEFKVVASDIPEVHHDELTAGEISQINAYRKARAVAKKFPDALVLGADTLVWVDSALFGKPASLEDAYLMLQKLQGRTHQVVTAMCLLHLREHRQRMFFESTEVTFRPLDAVQIRRYLTKVNPLDKAGAYAIQEEGDLIVEKISGSYTNVVGLPVERLRTELEGWSGGWRCHV
ncbi:MAG TPA: Maf family protein [Candidatus Binatia bacterium]|nr:Maf family protein [Candidatus Binatia bacterium]